MAARKILHIFAALHLVMFCQAVDIKEVTRDNFQDTIKSKKSLFLYATKDNCIKCKLNFRHFVVAAQNFQNDPEVGFGTVSDTTLLEVFEVTDVPAIVFYEYGSATPRVYRGDITATALIKIFAQATKNDFRTVDKYHTLELTKENFDYFMDNEDQYRLIMLHEEDDDDDIDLFEDLAETFENELGVLLARINVDKEKKLKRDFNTNEYPSFYWYNKGSRDKKKRYAGVFDLSQMINFVNKEANVFRLKGGKLSPFAGLIKPLSDVLSRHGKDLYEIRNYEKIRFEMQAEIAKLPDNTDKELVEFYEFLLNEMQEDKTIESLDEARNRLYRQMDTAGPQHFDQVVRKRNIVQKFVDVIGNHLLQELAGGDFGMPTEEGGYYEGNTQPVPFHEEF